MKTSYQKILSFTNSASKFDAMNRATEGYETTKLDYALSKMLERLKSMGTKYLQKRADVELEYALEDPKTGAVLFEEIIRDDQQIRLYKYSKEGLKKKDIAVQELFEEVREFDIEPHYATTVPADLHDALIEVFKGFAIDPSYEKPVKKEVTTEE